MFVAVSITDTLSLPEFVTYAFVPAELTATPQGEEPTSTVAITVFVVVSITETLLSQEFVIYAYGPMDEAFLTSISFVFESVPFALLTVKLTL